MSVRANFALIREAPPEPPRKSWTTAVIASAPAKRSNRDLATSHLPSAGVRDTPDAKPCKERPLALAPNGHTDARRRQAFPLTVRGRAPCPRAHRRARKSQSRRVRDALRERPSRSARRAVADESRVRARSRPHRPQQGLPPAQAQDAGLPRSGPRPLPHAPDRP